MGPRDVSPVGTAALADLMPWGTSGIGTGRTWVYAPERETLRRRWARLAAAEDRNALLQPTRSRNETSRPAPLPGCDAPAGPLAREVGATPRLVRVARRPFDRQWLVADHRVVDFARPELWRVRGDRQVYLTQRQAGDPWPLLCSALLPDAAHHGGRGGRVAPLYRDPAGREPNLAPGLVELLAARLAVPVAAEDLFAWIVAVTVDPARVPLTADPRLWAAGVELGRRLIALYTFGARFGRPGEGKPRLPGGRRPFVREPVPARPIGATYDEESRSLLLGTGRIGPVPREVWDLGILEPWIAARTEPPGEGLERIRERTWSTDLTSELIDLLHVLGLLADLTEEQTTLRTRAAEAPTLDPCALLPPAPATRRPPTVLDITEEGPGGQAVLV
ncbi:type ISP restriction/modification enzyme [Embleya sp. NPDC050493]|uniref:type ISP restriction/modification enzyme n=1 Tax=Embleya sp. NPDC050493 TaxID=3363989 RepID=UPI0037B6DF74